MLSITKSLYSSVFILLIISCSAHFSYSSSVILGLMFSSGIVFIILISLFTKISYISWFLLSFGSIFKKLSTFDMFTISSAQILHKFGVMCFLLRFLSMFIMYSLLLLFIMDITCFSYHSWYSSSVIC